MSTSVSEIMSKIVISGLLLIFLNLLLAYYISSVCCISTAITYHYVFYECSCYKINFKAVITQGVTGSLNFGIEIS
jgi:hypothetical protein